MIELNKFHNVDCMTFMVTVPDKYFELAIVDVPYGIKEAAGKNASRNKGFNGNTKNICFSKDYGNKDWDNYSPDKNYFNSLIRISKNQIIFGANHFISKVPYDSSCWIVWDKDNGDSDFADCELAWTSFKTAVRKFKFRWNGLLQENMKEKQVRIHPTEKPIVLYRWLLQKYAKKGDKIFDSHVGSASSLIACHLEGFEYVGCELDPDYYKEANERLEAYKAQGDLFH